MPTAAPSKSISATGIELFKAGLRRDSDGRERVWTEPELDEMVSSYNAVVGKLHDAPVQVGHDQNLAYGWLERAYRDGNTIKGDYKEVDPAFAEAVNAGRYKKRSISIYPPEHPDNPTPGKFNIRHVAYVGIPAVKGLVDHTFNDSGEGFWEYTAGDNSMVKEMPAPDFKDAKGFAKAWAATEDMDELDQDSARRAMIAAAREMKIKLPAAALQWEKDGAEPEPMPSKSTKGKKPMKGMDMGESVAWQSIASVFQNLRDRMIKTDGVDAAEQFIPQSTINTIRAGDQDADDGMPAPPSPTEQAIMARLDMLANAVMNLQSPGQVIGQNYEEQPTTAMTEENKTNPTPELPNDFAERLATQDQKINDLLEQNTQLKAQVAVLTESRANLAAERERDRVASFVENLASNDQRKLRPADVKSVIELAMAMPNDTAQDFSEGDGVVSVTPRQRYLDSLAAAKPLWSNTKLGIGPENAPPENAIVNFSAAPGYTVDQDSAQLHNKAVAYCQKQGWDYKEEAQYTQALIAVTEGAN